MFHTIVKVTPKGEVNVLGFQYKRLLTRFIYDIGIRPSNKLFAAGQCINEDVEGNLYLIFRGGPLALQARYGIVGKQQKLFKDEDDD
jgi:hypothetical protein